MSDKQLSIQIKSSAKHVELLKCGVILLSYHTNGLLLIVTIIVKKMQPNLSPQLIAIAIASEGLAAVHVLQF